MGNLRTTLDFSIVTTTEFGAIFFSPEPQSPKKIKKITEENLWVLTLIQFLGFNFDAIFGL